MTQNTTSRIIVGAAWGVILMVIVGVFGVFTVATLRKQKASEKPLPVLGTVHDFTLTNQLGNAVSLKDFEGKPWLASVIFTRCPGPCVVTSRNFGRIQSGLPSDLSLRIVSITTDPEFDTPTVMKRYGERFGADPKRWWLLSGPKPVITRLATNDLMLVVVDKPQAERSTPEDLFLHSTRFILVDAHSRVRGVYDGESSDTSRQVIGALRSLALEPATGQ